MSDASQGQGWWQASDGKWYPPQQVSSPPPPLPPPPGASTPQMGAAQPAAPPPPQQTVVVQKSNTGTIVAILAGVFCLVPLLISVVAIIAITFLGSSASQKFSTIGSSVGGFITGLFPLVGG